MASVARALDESWLARIPVMETQGTGEPHLRGLLSAGR
jgi:hypothetical protein